MDTNSFNEDKNISATVEDRETDLVVEARELVIQLGQERKSALCKAVTHKVVEAHAQNVINRLADEVEQLRLQNEALTGAHIRNVLRDESNED